MIESDIGQACRVATFVGLALVFVEGALEHWKAHAPSDMPLIYMRPYNDTRWLLTFDWTYSKSIATGHSFGTLYTCDCQGDQCRSDLLGDDLDLCDKGHECEGDYKIHHAPCGTCLDGTAQFCSEDGTKVYRVTYASSDCSQPLGECDECGKVDDQKDLPQERSWVRQPKDAVCEERSCSSRCITRSHQAFACTGDWQFEKHWFSVDDLENIDWPCQSGLAGTVI